MLNLYFIFNQIIFPDQIPLKQRHLLNVLLG